MTCRDSPDVGGEETTRFINLLLLGLFRRTRRERLQQNQQGEGRIVGFYSIRRGSQTVFLYYFSNRDGVTHYSYGEGISN